MKENFSTPMMKQYSGIKKNYQDCLLFYRMGDFYELFLEDAHVGARVLNITLTGKANGKGGRIPMAGVPYHAVDTYLAKLVKAGYKVAICEQLSPPNKKGLVERDVVRIVTPGTMMDEKALEKKENNYIVSLQIYPQGVAFAIADISTGYFATTEIITENIAQIVTDEFNRMQPRECILSEKDYNNAQILTLLKRQNNLNIFPFGDWEMYAGNAKKMLKEHFNVGTLAGFALEEKKQAQQASAALLGYLQQTQKAPVQHIKKLATYGTKDYLQLDRSTMLNLELFTTIRDHETNGTLLSVMDHTVTAMGGRLLKSWMKKPLLAKEDIENRHVVVSEFLRKQRTRNTLQELLKEVSDIERLLSRCSVGLGNARDLVNLKNSLKIVLEIKKILKTFESPLLQTLQEMIHVSKKKSQSLESLDSIITYLEKYIVTEPPISVREGNMINRGIHKELDKLRTLVSGSRDWIVELEQQERARTGINSLKVRFNQVFGFYIEVSKSNLNAVPSTYIRKQTLVNAERFITAELKEQEEIILSAEEKMHEIEYALFQETVVNLLDHVSLIQDAARSIASVDCLVSFACLAEKRNYIRPEMISSGEMHVKEGRHPVVETLLENKQFVPNDVSFASDKQQLLLLTGPNMAGKSVFIRQNALLVLMAQMGSFVPAKEAKLSLVDQIFVRSGASDVITSGLSTFMVEMVETAHILHHATERSFIIMDEIGRGTSTYDGISIAWAVAEYLVSQKESSPKTLFATHYHELQVLEERYPKQIHNYHMAVSDDDGEPVFLHTILPGGASHSFGVAVAKLAGIPETVIKRAKELLEELEERSIEKPQIQKYEQPQQMQLLDHLIHKELEQIDISQMTPLEALNKLADLKEKLKLFTDRDKKLLSLD